jgi:hypothetical protein
MADKCSYNVSRLRNLFSILLLLLAAEVSEAQKFNLGVKVGGSVTWPGFGDREDKDVFSRRLKAGYATALLIDFPLKNNYNVVLEGGYSKKGRRLVFDNNRWENNTTYQFIDMGMVLRRSFNFQLRKNVPSQWFINMGPEINYIFDARGKILVLDNPWPYTVTYDQDGPTPTSVNQRNVNDWLFNIGLGVGLKTPLHKNQHLVVELRFLSGHTFLGKKDSRSEWVNLNFQDTLRTNLKSFVISIGYTLDRDIQEGRKGKSTVTKKLKKGR